MLRSWNRFDKYIYFIIYCLFNSAVSKSEYIAWKNYLIIIDNELERRWKEMTCGILWGITGTFAGRDQRTTRKSLNETGWCIRWGSNWPHPIRKYRNFTTWANFLIEIYLRNTSILFFLSPATVDVSLSKTARARGAVPCSRWETQAWRPVFSFSPTEVPPSPMWWCP